MAEIFDGKRFAKEKESGLKEKVMSLRKMGIEPSLATVYLPTDPGSALYTKLKGKAAEAAGIRFLKYEIRKEKVQKVISLIKKLNKDSKVHGILVQKPSGENDFDKEDWREIVLALDPKKDVDGLTPENLGLLSIGTPRFIPATVKAVLAVLESWKIRVAGKNIVILGASEILGKPLSMILTDQDATVSILHGQTRETKRYTLNADIVISATGVHELIHGNMIKKGSAVIDVGAPKGDVISEEVSKVASFLSPVPGGIGPVTISCLLENLLFRPPGGILQKL